MSSISSVSSLTSISTSSSFYDTTEDSEDDILSVSSSFDSDGEDALVRSPASDNLLGGIDLSDPEYMTHEE